jgi:RimJ/RimL family protein N-acetyltransferase
MNLFSFSPDLANLSAERITRELTIDDLPAYRAFISNLSAQAKYQRTLGGVVTPSEAQLVQLLSPKPTVETVLGIFAGVDLVAVGRFAPILEDRPETLKSKKREINTCEFAVTIADAWQGMGLGTSLLKKLKVDAANAGYKQMMAWVFSDNAGMLGLAQSQGFSAETDVDDPALQRLQCSLLPTSALLNARTPKRTPAIKKPIPKVLNKPGKVALHK